MGSKENKDLVKHETVMGITMPRELAERLKAKYQDKQLDKLSTSVEAREAHVKKVAELKAEFQDLTSGTSGVENVKALNPKLRAALADRVMARSENRLLDVLEQIHKEEKAIKKIDDSFDMLGELL